MAILPPLPPSTVVRCRHDEAKHTCVRCAMEGAQHRAQGRATSPLRPLVALACDSDNDTAFRAAVNAVADDLGDASKEALFPNDRVTTVLGLAVAMNGRKRAAGESARVGRMVKDLVTRPLTEKDLGIYGGKVEAQADRVSVPARPVCVPSLEATAPTMRPCGPPQGPFGIRISGRNGVRYATTNDSSTPDPECALAFHALDDARAFLRSCCDGWLQMDNVAIVNDFGEIIETAAQVRQRRAPMRAPTRAPTDHPLGWPAPPVHKF